MKELIPMNEYGLMADNSYTARVDSRMVAEVFGKNHYDVLRNIKRIIGDESGFSSEFTERNFAVSRYFDSTGRKQPCYLMTRDGFTTLVMSFTGKKADAFKEWYINRFNEMEQQILKLQSLREQFPLLTEALKAMAEEPEKPYIYSNEMNMLNRIALGVTAKQYREEHNIPKSEPLRPYLASGQADLLDKLQHADVGFVYGGLTYKERQQKLEWCAYHWRENNVLPPCDNKEKSIA